MEEPKFVLRAQDVHAPQTIIDWARVVISNPNSTRVHFDKATAALSVANQMLEWQQLNPDKVKIPDLTHFLIQKKRKEAA
jgi:hypothetical protein